VSSAGAEHPSSHASADLPTPGRGWRWRDHLFVVVLALFFVVPFPYFPFLNSPNELARLYQVRALVDDGTPAVNGPVARFGEVGDLSTREGRRYPNKAPGVSYLGAPVYAALRALLGGQEAVSNAVLLYWLRLLICGLPTVLLAMHLRRFAARVSGDTGAATAAVAVWAIGSLAYPYGLLFFSHGPAANLLAAAWLVLAMPTQDPGEVRRGLAGALCGVAVCCEYTAAPVAAAISAYGLWRAERPLVGLFSTALGALPFAALLGAYHQAAWGHPLKTGYAFVENTTFAKWHSQGFMGVAVPDPVALLNHLFHPSRGLFAWTPALLLAIPGLRWLVRASPRDGVLALGISAFYLFLASAFLYEAWGWMLGPRHLTPWIPFLVAPLALTLARLRMTARDDVPGGLLVGGAAGLASASILVNGLGAVTWPHIPEEFSAAWAHLLGPLLFAGLRPSLALELLTGTLPAATWWLVYAAFVVLAIVVAKRIVPTPFTTPRIAGFLLSTMAVCSVLAFAHPGRTTRERETVEWIRKQWVPKR